MELEIIRDALGWCGLINIGILFFWFFMLVFAGDLVYRLHTKWFKMSREQFDIVHYSAIAFYKLAFFLFNIVPYLALRIVI